MNMSDAAELMQVPNVTQANEALADGWLLLAVVPAANSSGQAIVAYVLGKPRPSKAPELPKGLIPTGL
ncbi:hypothetical protein [Metapseudomonas otitidis]|uniref:hypothetical protein n=1 Tax=Metapseudomonas otitidis TaxID=319939 RepID=UPI000D1A7D9E|nr:hypothetical protein [Pseudomonas otitidis]